MKASELMICDWVRLVADDSQECLKVAYVRKDGVGFECYNHFFDEIEGIPIDGKILRANGFKLIRDKTFIFKNSVRIHKYEYIDLWKLEVGNDPECDVDGYVNKDIEHVHQIQHALRLCGLNELADNFKIQED